MKGAIISVFLVVAMVVVAEHAQADYDCGPITVALAPCVPYLTQGGTPDPKCCEGVTKIKALSTTADAKRNACNCVKDAANRYPTLKDDAAQALPDKCGVKLDIPVSRTTNCDAI